MFKYELIVLGFLSDRPVHGYQMWKLVKLHRMDSWAQFNFAAICPSIEKFKKRGMIKTLKVEREGLMPERRIYRLTPRGKRRLAKLIERSLMGNDLTNDLSNLAYFFVSGLPKDKAIECLSQRKALSENTVKSLRKRFEEFKGKTSTNRLFVIEKDLDRFKSELSHLKKLIKTMEDAPI